MYEIINRRNKRIISAIIMCLIIFSSSLLGKVSVSAVSYQGSGTESDPYLIETPEQLQGMKSNVSACYKLSNTIDLSSISNFTPIGNLEKPFTGTFICDTDADGYPLYVIKNLKIVVNESNYLGEKINRWECALFGATDGATVSNIYVIDGYAENKNLGTATGAVVFGNYRPGMDELNCALLIGDCLNSTVTHCMTSGTVTGRCNWMGGLIGKAYDSTVIQPQM